MRAAVRTAVSVVATTGFASWRRRGVVTISGLVAAGVGLVAAGQLTPTYAGTASVLVGPPPGASTSSGERLAATPTQVADAAVVMVSPTVRTDAAKLAGVASVPPAHARVVHGSDVVEVTVETHTAATAARDALAYADAYVAREQVTSIDGLQGAAATAASQVTALVTQIADLDARIAASGGPPVTPSTTAPPVTLYPGLPQYTLPTQVTLVPTATVPTPPASTGNPTVDALLAQRTALQAREAVLAQQATKLATEAAAFSGGGQVTSGGTPPGSPVRPDTTVWAVGFGIAGLLVAAGLVTAAEWRRSGPVVLRWSKAGAAAPSSPATPEAVEPVEAAPPATPAPRTAATSPAQRGERRPVAPAPRSSTVVLRPRPVSVGAPVTGSAGVLRFAPRSSRAVVQRADSAPREHRRDAPPPAAPEAEARAEAEVAVAPTAAAASAGAGGRPGLRRRDSMWRRRQALQARPTRRGHH